MATTFACTRRNQIDSAPDGRSARLNAAVVVLGAYRSRWVVGALVIGTWLSVLLGAVQLSQGGPYL